MTFEDESSVYVGGLAYTSTEDELQEAFEAFGEILSVKIVYDRDTGHSRGFGFVTFSNPRFASKAISELDGGIIGGRTVRVNEVRKHAGMNVKLPGPFRDKDLDIRDRDRERLRDRDRNLRGRLSPPRNRRTSPGLGRSARERSPVNVSIGRSARGRSPDMSSSQGRSARARSPVPRRSCTPLKERSPSLDSSSAGRHRRHSATSQSPGSSEQLRQVQETPVRVPPPPPPPSRIVKLEKRKAMTGHPESLKVREELDKAHQSRQELEEKVAHLTSAVERAEETVAALHSRSKKLEEALENSLAAANNRQLLLRKMQRGILQVKDSSERLSRHEKELKILMNSIASEMDVLEEEGDVMVNGGHFDGELKVDNDIMLVLSDKTRLMQ